MFGALIKAFTGRAGWLAGLLALLIAAVVAYAAVKATPRIGQSLISEAQTLLQSDSSNNETLAQIHAEGRDLIVSGQIEDAEALKAKLLAIDGVRRVLVDNTGSLSANSQVQSSESETDTVAAAEEQPVLEDQAVQVADNAEDALESASKMSVAQGNNADIANLQGQVSAAPSSTGLVSEIQGAETKALTDTVVAQLAAEESSTNVDKGAELGANTPDGDTPDQSSLSLRYDGTQLNLTGHVGDDQLAALISQEVRHAMPGYSELETSVDGQGGVSGLNWMNQFLDAVAQLPSDAQGVISGSDIDGVQIIPDTEQKLLLLQDEQQNEPEDVAEQTARSDGNASEVLEDKQVEPKDQVAALQPVVNPDENVAEPVAEQPVSPDMGEAGDDQAAVAVDQSSAGAEQTDTDTPTDAQSTQTELESPSDYILSLNQRMAQQAIFNSGDIEISQEFAAELDQLVQMMHNNRQLFLRIVGNLDFSVGPRDAEYVGVDRAREVRDYIRAQGVERFRVFSAPLPRDYAFDKQVQVVFYISE